LQVKNTVFIGKVLLHFDRLPSTNAYAQELLSKSRPSEGTVILADYQSAGRGQIGSTWEVSPGKNLTFSLILSPGFLPAPQQFVLSQAVSLAIRDFLSTLCPKSVYVKWPNDIYIEEKKVCGILIQNSLSGKKIQNSIIGIGLNVNQEHFPKGLDNASSLALETGKTFDLPDLFSSLLQHLEQRYQQLRSGKLSQIQQDYLKHLFLYQKEAMYCEPGGSPFTGKIVNVNTRGQLGIARQTEITYYNIKEIKYLGVKNKKADRIDPADPLNRL